MSPLIAMILHIYREIYGENLQGKFKGKIYGENLGGKFTGESYGENVYLWGKI